MAFHGKPYKKQFRVIEEAVKSTREGLRLSQWKTLLNQVKGMKPGGSSGSGGSGFGETGAPANPPTESSSSEAPSGWPKPMFMVFAPVKANGTPLQGIFATGGRYPLYNSWVFDDCGAFHVTNNKANFEPGTYKESDDIQLFHGDTISQG